MKRILLYSILLLFLVSSKSDKPAYRLFNAKGKSVSYSALLEEAKQSDVVCFGEMHDNPICHWLELQLTKDLYEYKQRKLVLGAEMFETDNQLLLKEYTSKVIRKKDFEAEAKLWGNYKTDYAPLVDFARENNLKFIATNIPRRFAVIVNFKGFEGLDSLYANERGLMAPLPIHYNPELGCYKNMLAMLGPEAAASHAMDNLPKAQAIKDATMGWFIFKNLQTGTTFLHFNGSYHSENHEGIVWYINDFNRRTANTLKIMTIACAEQESIKEVSKENLGKADFIICIPNDMTKTIAPSASEMPSMKSMPGAPAAMPVVKKDTVKVDTTVEDEDEGGDDD
jgi:uncharacterized iron-regulated protein